jgi:hypothetical protein
MVKILRIAPKKQEWSMRQDKEYVEFLESFMGEFNLQERSALWDEIDKIVESFCVNAVPIANPELFTSEQLVLIENYKDTVVAALHERAHWVAVELILFKIRFYS